MKRLVDYESDSEDDDPVLTQGPSDTKRPCPGAIQKIMPPLPSFFASARPKDDPVQHQGRVRSKPHVRNSWATCVYAKVALHSDLRALLAHVLAPAQIHAIPEPHISLSRTIFLREHQLDSFAAAVLKRLDSPRFSLSFAQAAVLTNDEDTRSFVTVEVGQGYNELSRCLAPIDAVVKAYGHPVYYQPPRFHASIAWSLSKDAVQKAVQSIPASLLDTLTETQHPITSIYIDMGKGNRVVKVPLPTRSKGH